MLGVVVETGDQLATGRLSAFIPTPRINSSRPRSDLLIATVVAGPTAAFSRGPRVYYLISGPSRVSSVDLYHDTPQTVYYCMPPLASVP